MIRVSLKIQEFPEASLIEQGQYRAEKITCCYSTFTCHHLPYFYDFESLRIPYTIIPTTH